MQNVVQVLEKQYLEEKRSALEEQRLRYERELDLLRQQLSPERSSQHHQRSNSDRLTFPTHTKMRLWTEDRYTHTHTHVIYTHTPLLFDWEFPLFQGRALPAEFVPAARAGASC